MNLLISKNDLIEQCSVSINVDDKDANVAIKQAHNKLKAIFCRDFYNELLTQYEAGTLTADNTALMSYVIDYLVWEAYVSLTVVGSFSHTKSGFREHTDENSNPVDNNRIAMIKKNAEEQANLYRGEMMAFINENIDNYSTYKTSDCYTCQRTQPAFKISGAGSKDRYVPWYYRYPYNKP